MPCESVRGGFEQDGGLALVGRRMAYAEDGAHSVEQAPHAASEWAVDAALDHARREFLLVRLQRVQERGGARMVEQIVVFEQREGVASGIANGCGSAREGPGLKMGRAVERGERRQEHLAAPYGAVELERTVCGASGRGHVRDVELGRARLGTVG